MRWITHKSLAEAGNRRDASVLQPNFRLCRSEANRFEIEIVLSGDEADGARLHPH